MWSPGLQGAASSAWQGSREILLPVHKRSVGSSALSPVSGISYIPARDICVITLSEGSFYTVHNFSVAPSLQPGPSSENASSDALSTASRCIFARVEPEPVATLDVARVNGMLSYDEGSTFAWTYE